jgi:hypothetical protein
VDLKSISKIELSGQGIDDVGSFSACALLEELELRYALSQRFFFPIAILIEVLIFLFSGARFTQFRHFDGVRTLRFLRVLFILLTVSFMSGLLEARSLKRLNLDGAPVCRSPDYRAYVISRLPHLIDLDGVYVVSPE